MQCPIARCGQVQFGRLQKLVVGLCRAGACRDGSPRIACWLRAEIDNRVQQSFLRLAILNQHAEICRTGVQVTGFAKDRYGERS